MHARLFERYGVGQGDGGQAFEDFVLGLAQVAQKQQPVGEAVLVDQRVEAGCPVGEQGGGDR